MEFLKGLFCIQQLAHVRGITSQLFLEPPQVPDNLKCVKPLRIPISTGGKTLQIQNCQLKLSSGLHGITEIVDVLASIRSGGAGELSLEGSFSDFKFIVDPGSSRFVRRLASMSGGAVEKISQS